MQKELTIKSRTLGGSADLTLFAPIKPGFIDALESVTYRTRIKRVLESLHLTRMSAHEYAAARLLSDAIDRVGVIQSVRVAVFEPENKLLLSVTFDGNWESYLRVLWHKVGTLLDLIFCSTQDYVSASEHSFDEWQTWARRVQINTGFFYAPSDSTAADLLYLRPIQRRRDTHNDADLIELRSSVADAEQRAMAVLNQDFPVEDRSAHRQGVDPARMEYEAARQGLQGLLSLHRLSELFLPGTPDGRLLHRAARELLLEFVQAERDGLLTWVLDSYRPRYNTQLDWLFPALAEPPARRTPKLPTAAAPDYDRSDVQGGIVTAYENISHGALAMLSFESPGAAGRFMEKWADRLTTDAEAHDAKDGQVFRNFSLTAAGLRALGVSEDEFNFFPEEFRQGMRARAGSLGDVRSNHPRRWSLPQSWKGPHPVDLDAVHAVMQLRTLASTLANPELDVSDAGHPLAAEFDDLQAAPGVKLLAVQALRRHYRVQNGQRVIVEHFGFADGNSQPEISPREDRFPGNQIHLGELLLGHDNAADFGTNPNQTLLPASAKTRAQWLYNGSFLVVRRYRQYTGRLTLATKAAAEQIAADLTAAGQRPPAVAALQEDVLAKLMGRSRNGTPLITSNDTTTNGFDYRDDPEGRQCPLSAHIRRAHPRTPPHRVGDEASPTGGRPPRLMRRSMSYGPALTDDERADPVLADQTDRGLVFMAYNASIGEQFEVVQRWLAGGNSTGGFSGRRCPIVGVPDNGQARVARFEYDSGSAELSVRVPLDGQDQLLTEPPVLTQLAWGLYLFTPSLSAVRQLATVAASRAIHPQVPWELARGRALIAELRQGESTEPDKAVLAWKAALEDPDAIQTLDSAAIWAAIREDNGGVLKTPYGTLVASRELLHQVLQDPTQRYSVGGQLERMKRCFGAIYLGMDDSADYTRQSGPVNAAISALPTEDVFTLAKSATETKVQAIIQQAREKAEQVGESRFEAGIDLREVVDEVLAVLCEVWFGISTEGGHFQRGGSNLSWQPGEPPYYPGHFTALSRYMFQPHPGHQVEIMAQAYGQSLLTAMRAFVDGHRRANTVPTAPIAAATFKHADYGNDAGFVARTMVGVLMGFIPTVAGAILNVLGEWLRDGSFWRLRATAPRLNTLTNAKQSLHPAMADAARMRPMPQLVWRTVLKAHRIGTAGGPFSDVEPGELVVLAFVSGTQQSLAEQQDDGRLMFGGVRQQSPHPTHACPGYFAAIAAMLGTLSALVACPGSLRASASPLTILFDERLPPRNLHSETIRRALRQAPPQKAAKNSQGRILAWGDSWVHYPLPGVRDLREQLSDRGYDVPRDFCNYRTWGHVSQMAARREVFCEWLNAELWRSPRPLAILLSGGGNDSTDKALTALLRAATGGETRGEEAFDSTAVDGHIAHLRACYTQVLDAIAATMQRRGLTVPVLLHGYDHPIPDGGETLDYSDHWMKTPFVECGYKLADGNVNLAVATPAMAYLIDRLNDMQIDLATHYTFTHHVDLRGKLAARWPQLGRDAWVNDLHPSDEGFALLAAEFDAVIQGQVSLHAAASAAASARTSATV